jgi:hypothetical protein
VFFAIFYKNIHQHDLAVKTAVTDRGGPRVSNQDVGSQARTPQAL